MRQEKVTRESRDLGEIIVKKAFKKVKIAGLLAELLPNEDLALAKCLTLYNKDQAGLLIKKNRKTVKTLYLLALGFMLPAVIFEGITALFLFALIIFGIYKARYSTIDQQIKRDKEAITQALPELMDRVVLLMSAGMYIEGILEKIAEDYGSENFLFIKISELEESAKERNKSIVYELSEYSVKTGIRELIRFANILENNFHKGSDLMDKLEVEGALLWSDRRKKAEERAKKAETKLSFPLMLLLLSLITITSAPMMMSI